MTIKAVLLAFKSSGSNNSSSRPLGLLKRKKHIKEMHQSLSISHPNYRVALNILVRSLMNVFIFFHRGKKALVCQFGAAETSLMFQCIFSHLGRWKERNLCWHISNGCQCVPFSPGGSHLSPSRALPLSLTTAKLMAPKAERPCRQSERLHQCF